MSAYVSLTIVLQIEVKLIHSRRKPYIFSTLSPGQRLRGLYFMEVNNFSFKSDSSENIFLLIHMQLLMHLCMFSCASFAYDDDCFELLLIHYSTGGKHCNFHLLQIGKLQFVAHIFAIPPFFSTQLHYERQR